MNLFFRIVLPAYLGSSQVSDSKNSKIPQPEGRQPKWDTRRTDYEEAGGLMEIQWLPGIAPDKDRLDKNGGLGSPQRFLVTFVRTKVTRGAGAEPPPTSTEVRGWEGPVKKGGRPVIAFIYHKLFNVNH